MASPALDSNGSGAISSAHNGFSNVSSLASGAITTSQSPDLIVAIIQLTNPSGTISAVSGITDGSLTWTRRASSVQASNSSFSYTVEMWTAPALATLSAHSFTANFTNNPKAAGIVVFAVYGVGAISAPFDTNAGLPEVTIVGNVNQPTNTFSTSQADDLLIYYAGNAVSTKSGSPSGWTNIASCYNNTGPCFTNVDVFYKSVSAIQSGATVSGGVGAPGTNAQWVGVVDAFTADAGGPNPFVRVRIRPARKRSPPRRGRTFAPYSINKAVGTAAGQATVSGHTIGLTESVGTAAGHATVSGASQAEGQSTASAAGHATVEGVGIAVAESVGTAAGHATVSGVGLNEDQTVGSAAGHATVEGVGVAVRHSVGIAPGQATVDGITDQRAATAAGHATLHGVSGGGPETQIAAVARETLLSVPAVGQIAAIVRETLADPTALADMSAIARETLLRYSGEAQVSAIIREALYASLSSPAAGSAAGHATVSGVAAQNQAIATAAGQATVQGISISVIPPEPPQGPTLTQNIIPSYLYVQYNDDNDLQAMVAAYNAYTQAYLDYLNNLNLPIYTTDPVSGLLLDWVGTNLYGYPRPALPQYGRGPIGPLNTWTPNEIVLNGWIPGEGTSYNATTDDIYRRCLTWHFYKGDGKQMSIRWLKRRIERFLNGINGTDTDVAATYDVSVTFPSPQHCTITLPTSSTSKIFQAAIQGGLLETPFQIEFTVDLT